MLFILDTDPDVVSLVAGEVVNFANVVIVVNSSEVHAPLIALMLSLILGKSFRVVPVVLYPARSSNADDSSHSGRFDKHLFYLN
jgi:hypothetical protein